LLFGYYATGSYVGNSIQEAGVMNKMINEKNGFTLIELLVVIAIIALLVSIVVPALSAARNSAKDVMCLSHLSQIGKGFTLYANDNEGHIPKNGGTSWKVNIFWILAFAPYVGEHYEKFEDYTKSEIFNCPRYPDREQTVDYIISSWGRQLDGSDEADASTRISDYTNPGTKIYITDYASPTYKDNNGAEQVRSTVAIIKNYKDLEAARAGLDQHYPQHLPTWPDKSLWKVEGDRHKREGSNAVFYDSHAEWVHKDRHIPQAYVIR
jgi:prepilin-type N-terminal cleavage/methylation domain-containing protein